MLDKRRNKVAFSAIHQKTILGPAVQETPGDKRSLYFSVPARNYIHFVNLSDKI